MDPKIERSPWAWAHLWLLRAKLLYLHIFHRSYSSLSCLYVSIWLINQKYHSGWVSDRTLRAKITQPYYQIVASLLLSLLWLDLCVGICYTKKCYGRRTNLTLCGIHDNFPVKDCMSKVNYMDYMKCMMDVKQEKNRERY